MAEVSSSGSTRPELPLVSILIPAYAVERVLAQTLQSALQQTWPNKEIIVVDDGSPDGTLELARKFEALGVKVITQENKGAAAARNTAYAHCRGEFIQWLDADDLLSPNKIANQIAAWQTHRDPFRLLSSGWAHFLNRPQNAVFRPSALWCDLEPSEWLLRKMANNLHMQTATWLISRELTEKAGGWNADLSLDDDGEYFCRVILASSGIQFVQGCGVYYRLAGMYSVSHVGLSVKKIESQCKSMKLHVEYLRSVDRSERARQACITYLQNWLIHFYPHHLTLLAELQKIAAELGGTLTPPKLPWKYEWIRKIFGWQIARKAHVYAPAMRWAVMRRWDKFMARVAGTQLPPAIRESSLRECVGPVK